MSYRYVLSVLEVTAPANIEAVVTDDSTSRTLRIHLPGCLSAPACTPAKDRRYALPGLIEDAPLYRTSIRIRRPVTRARAWSPSTEIRRADDLITATVDGVHEIRVIEY